MTHHRRLAAGVAAAGVFLLLALSLVLTAPREAQAAGPLGLCVGTGCVPNTSVNYVHWTSINPAGGTATGTITLPGGQVVGLNFTATNPGGSPSFFYGGQNGCGTNFWNPTAPYISPSVPNPPPNCELLQLSGGNGATYRLTLSEPIQDPVMAIVSLGSSSIPATYDFDSPFTIVSQGVGFWGGCATCLQQQPGDVLYGAEGHGTIRFLGTFPTFSWTVPSAETWHGFTFGIRTTAQLAGQVTVNEGQPAFNNGSWTGTAPNFHASVGNLVVNPGNGTWSWSMPTNDGPVQSQTVTITATEGGQTVTTNFPLVVNNVPPTAVLNNSGPTPVGGSVTASFTGQFDPSAPDQGSLRYAFACNGGSLAAATYATAAPSPSTSCTYGVSGPVTIRGRVIDKDGGFNEYTTSTVVLAPEGPPPFLRPIVSAFPNAPFTTCVQGIYKATVSPDINDTQLPEYWFVKAKATGVLNLAVNAVAVNTVDEIGTLTGTLTDLGGAPVGAPVTVTYPTGGGASPGDFNTGVISAGVTAGQVYRLKLVRNAISGVGVRPAHHYSLGFTGVAVDAGVNSPFVFEGGTQDVHVNVGASGAISLTLTQPVAPAPGGVANLSLGIYNGFTNLFTLPMTSTGSPINVNLTGLAPGNYLVALSSDQHFTMTNNSVDDSGIYFDGCGGVPQPPMGKVTVVKTAVGGDGTFNFEVSGPAPASFPINTVGGTGTASAKVPAGQYTVTELTLNPGWRFDGVSCVSNGVATGTASGQGASVNVVAGEEVVCTFTNRLNQPPLAVADAVTTNEDTSVVIPVLANDSDPDGGTLTITGNSPVANGTLVNNGDGTFTYTPNANYNGPDSFKYTIADGQGGFAGALVTIDVKPVADPPIANPDSATTLEDTAVGVKVLANDVDPEGGALTLASVTQGTHGTVVVSGGIATYTPEPNWNGVDTFTYTVTSPSGTATATVTVTVTPVNDPPVAVDDTASTTGTTPVVVNVVANDSDIDGGPLTVASATPGTNGTTTVGAGGVTYTANAGFTGTDTFTYVVSDGNGGTATAKVTVTVAAGTVCKDRSTDRDDDRGKDDKGKKDDDRDKKNVKNFSSGDDDRDCGKPAPRMTGGGVITQAAPARPASRDDDKSKKDEKSKGDDDKSKKELKWTWGFELRCNATQGNFEYQDHTDGNFKLTSVTSAVCTDDPSVNPGSPQAGFDTMLMKGIGRWNGVAGHLIEVKLVDAGEPGTKDSIVLTVKTAAGAIVSQVSGNLSGGNHQAHK